MPGTGRLSMAEAQRRTWGMGAVAVQLGLRGSADALLDGFASAVGLGGRGAAAAAAPIAPLRRAYVDAVLGRAVLADGAAATASPGAAATTTERTSGRTPGSAA